MTLTERLSEFVRACFPVLWVQSFEHDDKRPVLLAGRDRRVERLRDLGAAEETVEVAKDQQGRIFLSGQCSQCLERGQRIRSADRGGSLLILSGNRQSAIDVPGGQ